MSASSPKATISDFGLVRARTVWEPKDTAFIDPYLVHASMQSAPRSSPAPPIPQWSTYKITLPQPGSTSHGTSRSPNLLNGYAVSTSNNAYVTFCVQLTSLDASRRYTPMRYRDIIVDNYVSASSSSCSSSAPLTQLRWLGVANILNTASRATFERIFQLSERDILSRGSVEISSSLQLRSDYPRHKEFRKLLLADPFTRGVVALLKHHSQALGRASVKRFIFLSEGFDRGEFACKPSPLELRLDLVVELTRSGNSAANL